MWCVTNMGVVHWGGGLVPGAWTLHFTAMPMESLKNSCVQPKTKVRLPLCVFGRHKRVIKGWGSPMHVNIFGSFMGSFQKSLMDFWAGPFYGSSLLAGKKVLPDPPCPPPPIGSGLAHPKISERKKNYRHHTKKLTKSAPAAQMFLLHHFTYAPLFLELGYICWKNKK